MDWIIRKTNNLWKGKRGGGIITWLYPAAAAQPKNTKTSLATLACPILSYPSLLPPPPSVLRLTSPLLWWDVAALEASPVDPTTLLEQKYLWLYKYMHIHVI